MNINSIDVRLTTQRFLLRRLQPEDCSHSYLGWMSDPVVAKYIEVASSTSSITELKEYVRVRARAGNSLLLGVFEKDSLRHIGNIKFEPIDFENSWAEVGVLIGEPEWRGKGVFAEIFSQCSGWLNAKFGIDQYSLGVDMENVAAISAYEKSGFRKIETTGSSPARYQRMSLRIPSSSI